MKSQVRNKLELLRDRLEKKSDQEIIDKAIEELEFLSARSIDQVERLMRHWSVPVPLTFIRIGKRLQAEWEYYLNFDTPARMLRAMAKKEIDGKVFSYERGKYTDL
jgi:hypothetical protein